MEFDFSANRVVDTLDKIPEDFRGLYVQKEEGGKYVLNDDGPTKAAVAAIVRLNTALKAARTEAKNNKEKIVDLSALSDFGSSPEEILQGFNAKLEELKTGSTKTVEQQVSKIKEDLAKAHAAEGEKKDKRAKALEGQLFSLLGTGAAKKWLKELGAVDEDLALPHVLPSLKAIEANGEYDVRVVDEVGDVRYSGVTGAPMTVKELVAEMKTKQKFAPLFKSETPQGGGTQPGGPTRQPLAPQAGEKNSVQKISEGLKGLAGRR